VNFYIDPEAEQAGLDKMTSILRIHLKNGKVLSARGEFAKGSPSNPMTYDEVAEKFKGCADFVKWPAAKTQAVIQFVKSLENAPDVGKLAAALTV
jgi:2-methylcitrate dehydratase PrpD